MSGVGGIVAFCALLAVVAAAVIWAGRAMPPLALPRREERRPGAATGRVRGTRRLSKLGLDELQEGVLVGGSPGAGKTNLLLVLARDLPPGIGLAFVDLKGDLSIAGKLGIPPCQVFGLGAAAAWNPLVVGNPGSWRDILLDAEEWTEPHYRRAAARYLGALLSALAQVRERVELAEVIAHLEQPKRATGLLREAQGHPRDALARAIAALDAEPSLRSGVLGLGNRLALLRDSPASEGRFGTDGGIDLEAVLRGERVLFSLPAAEFPDEAPAIAACAIRSLGAVGQKQARGDESLRALLVVDEAPRLGGQQLRGAVAIGRGAGIGAVVCVQDFADLAYIGAGTQEAVETGANTWVVMRQVASAEHIADMIGSRTTRRETVQHDSRRWLSSETGLRSVREVEEYRVSPNEIRDLRRGQAIVWRRLRGATVEHVAIDPIEPQESQARSWRWGRAA